MSDMSWKEKYPIGFKFTVEFEVKDHYTDEYDRSPIYISNKSSSIYQWVSVEQLEELIEDQNPSLKRKRIEQEIEELQQQLKELGE